MKYEQLKLENQLCFPLYAASKAITSKYKPYLDELELTYTQYIVMLVMWEHEKVTVKELGEKLYLDSGTLTPLIKLLDKKGYITKERSTTDERVVYVKITDLGKELEEKAKDIPFNMSSCMNVTREEAEFLYKILHKII